MPAFSFYATLVPLNGTVHGTLRVLSADDYGFSRTSQSVPIGAGEFFDCAVEFPIVFVRAPSGPVPVALLGVRADENVFVTPEGRWDSGYLPAFIRRYPFVTLDDGQGRLSVGIDETSSRVSLQAGDRLFGDDGQPAEAFRQVIRFLERAHGDFSRGEALARALDEKALLQPMTATLSIVGGTTIEVGGFEVVDVARLDGLSIGEQGLLAKAGDLALVHAHLVSMRNFRKLLAKLDRTVAPTA